MARGGLSRCPARFGYPPDARRAAPKADYAIEGGQYAVEIVYDIIARVENVAYIHADAHFSHQLHTVENLPQLFESTADLAALARHRLQQDGRSLLRPKNLIEGICNQRYPRLRALTYMAARMKIIEIAGQRLHAAKIIRHGLQREFTHARIRRAGVSV